MRKIVYLTLILLLNFDLHAKEYQIEEVSFVSHQVRLSGSLIVPKTSQVHAAVVFVHGSGKQERNLHWAKRFAAKGIAALVYDKRGVGRSEGEYESAQSVSEQNINLLADDSIAALKILKQHPMTKNLPLGLTGISQAGWIVPLAAEKSQMIDFMVLWSGPVCKVSEEDIYSKYTSDRDDNTVPSYAEALGSRKTKYVWPDFLGKDTDPSANLAKLQIPGLWIFGEKDGSIPVDLSIQRLKKLAAAEFEYEFILFSNLGHNNMTTTFDVAADWITRVTQTNKKLSGQN